MLALLLGSFPPAHPCIRCEGRLCKVDPYAGSLYCRTWPNGRCVDWRACGEAPRPVPPPPVIVTELLVFFFTDDARPALPAVVPDGEIEELRASVAALTGTTEAAVQLRSALFMVGLDGRSPPGRSAIASGGSGFLLAAVPAEGGGHEVRVCRIERPGGAPCETAHAVVAPRRVLVAPAQLAGRPAAVVIRVASMDRDAFELDGDVIQRMFWQEFERNRDGPVLALGETMAAAGCDLGGPPGGG